METMNNVVSCRTHRVGTITTGLCMVIFGVLLLLHTMFDIVEYQMIFSLWPMILIGLGMEMLLSNCFAKQMVYDKGSVVLLILMAFFAIGMAVAEVCIEATELYMIHGVY